MSMIVSLSQPFKLAYNLPSGFKGSDTCEQVEVASSSWLEASSDQTTAFIHCGVKPFSMSLLFPYWASVFGC